MKLLEIESKIEEDMYDGEDYNIIKEDRPDYMTDGIEVKVCRWNEKKVRHSFIDEWNKYVGKKLNLQLR